MLAYSCIIAVFRVPALSMFAADPAVTVGESAFSVNYIYPRSSFGFGCGEVKKQSLQPRLVLPNNTTARHPISFVFATKGISVHALFSGPQKSEKGLYTYVQNRQHSNEPFCVQSCIGPTVKLCLYK